MNKIYMQGYKDGKEDCNKEFRELVQGRIDELKSVVDTLSELNNIFANVTNYQEACEHFVFNYEEEEILKKLQNILASLESDEKKEEKK